MTSKPTQPLKTEIWITYIATFISSVVIILAHKVAADTLIIFYQKVSSNDITGYIANGFYLFLFLDIIELFLVYYFNCSHLQISSKSKNIYFVVLSKLLTNFLRFRRLFTFFCFIFYGGFMGMTKKNKYDVNFFSFISFVIFMFVLDYLVKRIKKQILNHVLNNFDSLYNVDRKSLIRRLRKAKVFRGLFDITLVLSILTLLFVILSTQYEPLTFNGLVKDLVNLRTPSRALFFGLFIFVLLLRIIFIEYQFIALLLKEFSFSLCVNRNTENIGKEANRLLVSYLTEVNKSGDTHSIMFVLRDIEGLSNVRISELIRLDSKNVCMMKILIRQFVVFLKGVKRKQKLDGNYVIDNRIFIKAALKSIGRLLSIDEIKYSEADDVKRLKKYKSFLMSVEKGTLNNSNVIGK